MVETPKPEHFGTIAEWLIASRDARGLENQDLAVIAHVTPQAVSKWVSGKGIGRPALKRLAVWSGHEYSHLCLLNDGEPIPGAPRRTREQVAAFDPNLERLKRKLEQLRGDADGIGDVEATLDRVIEKRIKGRRRVAGPSSA